MIKILVHVKLYWKWYSTTIKMDLKHSSAIQGKLMKSIVWRHVGDVCDIYQLNLKLSFLLRIWYTYLCFQSQKNQSTYEFVFVYFIFWIRYLRSKWNCLNIHYGMHLNNNSYISSQLSYMHIWCWNLFCNSDKIIFANLW